jgi:Tfp pilus assembly protein PilF
MAVSKKKRKQILRSYPRQSAEELALELGLELQEVRQVIQGAEKQPAVVLAPRAFLLPRRGKRAAIVAALVVVFGLLIYHSALSFSRFKFDTRAYILENRSLQVRQLTWPNIRRALVNSTLPSRPVANLSLILNFYFGQENPAGYHVVNQAIHLLNGVLVYIFLTQILSYLSRRGRFRGPVDLAAILASLLWFVNPVQSESVVYIIQRMNSLAALFYLLGLIAWFRFRRARPSGSLRPALIWSPRNLLYLAATVPCFLLALGSKEIAATFPLELLLIEVFIFRDLDPVWLRRYAWTLIPALGFLVLFGILVLGLHPIQALELRYAGRDFTMAQRLLTEPRVIWHYLLIYAFPIETWMNLDQDISVSTLALTPPSTLPALLGILAMLALAVRYARRFPLHSFAILWFFLHLAIESSIIPLELAYDHRLYLPSVGLTLVAALGIIRVSGSLNKTLVLGGLVVVLWAALAFLRVGDWQSRESLWRDCLSKSPLKARTHFYLGLTYSENDKDDRAIALFSQAIKLDPEYAKAYYNRGSVYFKHGQYDLAIADYSKAVELNPTFFEAWNNRGVIYRNQGHMDRAFQDFNRALKLDPTSANVYFNRGNAYEMLGQADQALADYARGFMLDPSFVGDTKLLSIARQRRGKR